MNRPNDDGLNEPSDVAALYNGNARRMCYTLSIAEFLLGVLIFAAFWATYVISVINAVVALSLGLVGMRHYRTRVDMVMQSCCCQPHAFIEHQQYFQIALSAGCIVASAVAVLAIVFPAGSGSVFLVFAIVNLVENALLLTVAVGLARTNAKLLSYSRQMQSFMTSITPTGFVVTSAVPVTAPSYPYGQPYTTPQQPYDAPQQPYSAPQQPYSAAQQPYSTPQQPYYAPQQPHYAPQQPYYAPQQPYYASPGAAYPDRPLAQV